MSNPVEPETKTVVIDWVEESVHQVRVRVPLDFDADGCNLGDVLAELDDDGFRGLERSQIAVHDVASDPTAEYFNPPRCEGGGAVSSHYGWGQARTGNYHLVNSESAPEEWGASVSASRALGLFNESGDGCVLEGEPGEILDYVDRLHAYAHRELDELVEYDDTRACALCGDQVLILSSRDWCDACEAVTIPGDVWRAFLAREATLTNEHPGEVSLSTVVNELNRRIAEHENGPST